MTAKRFVMFAPVFHTRDSRLIHSREQWTGNPPSLESLSPGNYLSLGCLEEILLCA
jgi:hypothetical protein